MSIIDPNLLDAETISTFLEMGNEVIASLVDLYIDNSTGEIENMVQAARDGSMDNIKKVAHSLKGASLNMGASAMGRLCLEIERNARENNLEGVREQINRLSGLLESTRQAYLKTYA